MSHAKRIGEFVLAVQNLFLEEPGLALTSSQVQQQCQLDDVTCRAVLNLLHDGGVVTRTSDGRYVRAYPRPSAVRRAYDRALA